MNVAPSFHVRVFLRAVMHSVVVLAGAACNDPVSFSRDPIPVRTNRLAGSGREICLVQGDGTAKCWGEHWRSTTDAAGRPTLHSAVRRH